MIRALFPKIWVCAAVISRKLPGSNGMGYGTVVQYKLWGGGWSRLVGSFGVRLEPRL